MKKLILSVAMLAGLAVNAQSEAGKIQVGVQSGTAPGSTNIYYSSEGDYKKFGIGANVGYFVQDDLALIAGLGYSNSDNNGAKSNSFGYAVGAKYYLQSQFPVQLDLNGSSEKDATEDPLYLGLQGGYAYKVSDVVMIEPALRYDISLNDKYKNGDGILSFNVGVNVAF